MKKRILIAAAVLCVGILAFLFFPSHNVPDVQPSAGTSGSSMASFSMAAAESFSAPPDSPEQPDGAVAWLHFDGTEIDGPVMQAGDNDYYLRRNEQGESDVWGCYYLDYECSPASKNYIIYGHSLEDTADAERFSQLKRLNRKEFADQHNIIQVTVDGQTRTYRVFSSGLASNLTDHETINANPDSKAMQNILDMALARSQHDYGVEVTPADSILTLSTCTSDENMRYVVVAKLLEG